MLQQLCTDGYHGCSNVYLLLDGDLHCPCHPESFFLRRVLIYKFFSSKVVSFTYRICVFDAMHCGASRKDILYHFCKQKCKYCEAAGWLSLSRGGGMRTFSGTPMLKLLAWVSVTPPSQFLKLLLQLWRRKLELCPLWKDIADTVLNKAKSHCEPPLVQHFIQAWGLTKPKFLSLTEQSVISLVYSLCLGPT